jgi:hypothetical protein
MQPFQVPRKEGSTIPLPRNMTTNTMKLNGVNIVTGQPQHHHVGNTRMKKKSFSIHKNLIETTKKGNVALVELINYIHEVNLQIKEK